MRIVEVGRREDQVRCETRSCKMFQRPLTLKLQQKHRDAYGRRIAIQIGLVYTTFCQEEGILLQKHRDRNGRCTACHEDITQLIWKTSNRVTAINN